jgi:hypothetical protein
LKLAGGDVAMPAAETAGATITSGKLSASPAIVPLAHVKLYLPFLFMSDLLGMTRTRDGLTRKVSRRLRFR